MIYIISPAKKLDTESGSKPEVYTQAEFLPQAGELINELRQLQVDEIADLMKISVNLAELNRERFLKWQLPFTPENAKPALLAFKGDVYQGIDAETLQEHELTYAQKHLRILSGLYGLLRPLDLIQAYRLEMGTKLPNPRGKNLYEFWGNTLTDKLQESLNQSKTPVLINLASQEYFKSIDTKKLKTRIITPIFKEYKNGKYQMVSFYAKKARGMMCRFGFENKITDPNELKNFDKEGYYYNDKMSTENNWLFSR